MRSQSDKSLVFEAKRAEGSVINISISKMNAFSDADLDFVKSVQHANTPIGVVAISNF
jgi:hypothetical protein